MLLKLDNIVWRDEPYRIGLAKPVMDEAAYRELVAAFPKGHMPGKARKMALSERCHPADFMAFVNASDPFKRLHDYIKSPAFFGAVQRATDLGPGRYTSRFEFSSFPANGGGLDPHTDIPSKVVTLVIPIIGPDDEWWPEWGGGTDVLKPLDPSKPLKDYEAPLSEFERVATYAYEPNQCVVFLKSDKSWHSVTCTGPAGYFRRSVCINIERAA